MAGTATKIIFTVVFTRCITNRCTGSYKFGNKYLPSACKTQFEFRSHFPGKKSASYRPGNTVGPRFTNKFSEQKSLGWRNGFSDYEHASWEYQRRSASCWLTLAQYTSLLHFGSRTVSRNGLSSWTKAPLYSISGFLSWTQRTLIF
jgi:hypothetical protein